MGAKVAFTGWGLFWLMAVAFVNMVSFTVAVPGLWVYLKELGAEVNYLGWCFAAQSLGAFLMARMLRDSPLGPIEEIKRVQGEANKFKVVRAATYKFSTKTFTAFLIFCGIGGNMLYAFSSSPAMVFVARFLVGMGSASTVICHRYIEFSCGVEDIVLHSRMVMLGAAQACGAIVGVLLAIGLAAIPNFTINGHSSSQPLCGLAVAALYIVCLPGILYSYTAPFASAISDVDEIKGEMDCPPNNNVGAFRFGVLIPAIVYDRGQAKPTSLPDVFSTAVLLVLYFMLNNLMVGIEVAHGPLCVDHFEWGALDIAITYAAFMCAGLVGVSLNLSLSDDVPCNRRLFGAIVMIFVTYGVMLQPTVPKEQYIGFLVIVGCCFYICDLAATEVYIDKVGVEDNDRMTAAYKLMFMNFMNTTATFCRVLGAIVTGYVYEYYHNHKNGRLPYAVYGTGFGVSILLVFMCMIFYKRFQMRSLEQQMLQSDKGPLLPQQINCMDDGSGNTAT